MESVKINKNSLTYRMVTSLGGIAEWELDEGYVDTCQYNTAIIKSVFFGVIILLLVGLFSFAAFMAIYAVSNFLAWIVFMMFNEYTNPAEEAVIVMVVGCVVLFVSLFVIASSALKKLPSSNKELYRSFKHKYCKRIEIV